MDKLKDLMFQREYHSTKLNELDFEILKYQREERKKQRISDIKKKEGTIPIIEKIKPFIKPDMIVKVTGSRNKNPRRIVNIGNETFSGIPVQYRRPVGWLTSHMIVTTHMFNKLHKILDEKGTFITIQEYLKSKGIEVE